MIGVYIDNNVWDFLFERGLELHEELPKPEFCLAMTREAEFEIPPIPDDKAELKAYIDRTIKEGVVTVALFGFGNPDLPPGEQRVAGFDRGSFASEEMIEFAKLQRTPLGKRLNEKTRLYRGEADKAIAARSLHNVVLTLDAKKGPIQDAYKAGGKVVFLSEFDESGLTLKEYVLAALAEHPSRTSPPS
ncbi:hypothetical protein NJC40_03405 [Pseudomonas sp. 21LCFQ02]|uniref:hypothetical protein n=1 Tax=Pseudomonas sp. 21LCFQ02 TaxID=2957505 RepID=UPI00209ACA67|nr:hypothetical protein [Pseudomonas sp. 21LCFQ02]MCO8166824.1 hypothetical protein [Pseudomonas sp. 21LCFQ02]